MPFVAAVFCLAVFSLSVSCLASNKWSVGVVSFGWKPILLSAPSRNISSSTEMGLLKLSVSGIISSVASNRPFSRVFWLVDCLDSSYASLETVSGSTDEPLSCRSLAQSSLASFGLFLVTAIMSFFLAPLSALIAFIPSRGLSVLLVCLASCSWLSSLIGILVWRYGAFASLNDFSAQVGNVIYTGLTGLIVQFSDDYKNDNTTGITFTLAISCVVCGGIVVVQAAFVLWRVMNVSDIYVAERLGRFGLATSKQQQQQQQHRQQQQQQQRQQQQQQSSGVTLSNKRLPSESKAAVAIETRKPQHTYNNEEDDEV